MSAPRPLRIGIDAHGVGGHSHAPGNESYFRNLIAGLLEIDSESEYHLFINHPDALEGLVERRPNARLVRLRPGTQWLQRPVSLPLYANRHGLDVLHVPFIRPPFVRARTVVTVHDISFETWPEFYPWVERWRMKMLVPAACRDADLILTVSEHVREQIVTTFGVPRAKVVITHNAADHMNRAVALPAASLPPDVATPYILYAGMIQPRKNLVRLARAFDRVRSSAGIPHQLVLAGRWGWGNQELERTLACLRHRDAVRLPGYVGSATLAALFSGAELFAFPSIFEGFAIPPLEAQASGVPALVANSSCFPEIFGDSVLYCDPFSIDSIAEGLLRLISDRALREDLIRRGRERAQRYSWGRTAQIVLDAYRRLAGRATEAAVGAVPS